MRVSGSPSMASSAESLSSWSSPPRWLPVQRLRSQGGSNAAAELSSISTGSGGAGDGVTEVAEEVPCAGPAQQQAGDPERGRDHHEDHGGHQPAPLALPERRPGRGWGNGRADGPGRRRDGGRRGEARGGEVGIEVGSRRRAGREERSPKVGGAVVAASGLACHGPAHDVLERLRHARPDLARPQGFALQARQRDGGLAVALIGRAGRRASRRARPRGCRCRCVGRRPCPRPARAPRTWPCPP